MRTIPMWMKPLVIDWTIFLLITIKQTPIRLVGPWSRVISRAIMVNSRMVPIAVWMCLLLFDTIRNVHFFVRPRRYRRSVLLSTTFVYGHSLKCEWCREEEKTDTPIHLNQEERLKNLQEAGRLFYEVFFSLSFHSLEIPSLSEETYCDLHHWFCVYFVVDCTVWIYSGISRVVLLFYLFYLFMPSSLCTLINNVKIHL